MVLATRLGTVSSAEIWPRSEIFRRFENLRLLSFRPEVRLVGPGCWLERVAWEPWWEHGTRSRSTLLYFVSKHISDVDARWTIFISVQQSMKNYTATI